MQMNGNGSYYNAAIRGYSPGSLRTLRISATGGTRTIASMIASSTGGAGSPIRVFKFISHYNHISPSDYFFDYLGGDRSKTAQFKQFLQNRTQR
jgi:hypothetical protein